MTIVLPLRYFSKEVLFIKKRECVAKIPLNLILVLYTTVGEKYHE